MIAGLTADAANLYYGHTETQRIYVRLALVNVVTGAYTISLPMYGDATGYDDPYAPQLDRVQRWYYGPNQPLPSYEPFRFNVNAHGTYQMAMQFKWDRGSAGAPASGWTGWYAEAGYCRF